jgi:hypothetical protein
MRRLLGRKQSLQVTNTRFQITIRSTGIVNLLPVVLQWSHEYADRQPAIL